MKTSCMKALLAIGFLVVSLSIQAQSLTFGSPLTGDPINGTSGTSVLSASGTGNTVYAPGSLQAIAVDKNGEIVFAASSKNRVGRLTATGKVITIGASTNPQSVIIDPNAEYLYLENGGGSNSLTGSFNAVGNILTLSAVPAAGKLYLGASVTGTGITSTAGTPNTFVTGISSDSLTITLSRPSTATSSAVSYSFTNPVITRFVWKNNGANTSFGFFVDSAPGKSSSTLYQIPFLYSGDSVFQEGSSSRTPIFFANMTASFAFDNAGNLYYSDKDNQTVGKISIVSVNATAKNKNDTLILASANASVAVGDLVSGMYIPRGTYVREVNGTQVILSHATTGAIKTTTGSIAFITGTTTIAGTFGTSGATGDGGAAISATFNQPRALAFDSQGNLYINDYANGKVRKITATGGVINPATAVISSVVSATISKTAQGLAFDANDNLFICDNGNKKIYRYSSAGVLTTVAGNGALTVAKCSTDSASAIVSTTGTFAKILPGMYLRGTGIPLGAKVVSVTDTAHLVINMPATANAVATVGLTFSSPDGVVASGTGYTDNPAAVCYNPIDKKLYYTENGQNLIRSLSSSVITPVKMVSFTAEKNDKSVLLKWQTSNEINNNYFVVEYSTNGNEWKQLSQLKALNNDGLNNYQFIHNTPAKVNYYRLKQVDKDGDFTYSEVRKVNFETKAKMSVYPNPVTNRFTVDMGDDFTTAVPYNIVNLKGSILQSGTISNRQQSISLNNITTGVYLLKVSNSETIQIIKK